MTKVTIENNTPHSFNIGDLNVGDYFLDEGDLFLIISDSEGNEVALKLKTGNTYDLKNFDYVTKVLGITINIH